MLLQDGTMTVTDQAEQLRQLARHHPDDPAADEGPAISSHPQRDTTREPDAAQRITPQQHDRRPARTGARIVAIASGKGGVGKSNISVNLSIRLTQMGRQVILVDADMGLANDDVLCGLSSSWNLSHILDGQARTVHDVMVIGPGGFRLLPGPGGFDGFDELTGSQRNRLAAALTELRQAADLLLVDAAAGIGPGVINVARLADMVLVVATPEPTSIADAYGLIKTIHRRAPECDLAVLINMAAGGEGEGRKVFTRLSLVARRFLKRELFYAGTVPLDHAVRRAVKARSPFVLAEPRCRASKAMTRLSHMMDRHSVENRNGQMRWARFFGRLFRNGQRRAATSSDHTKA